MVATTLKMGMSPYQIVLSTKFKSIICDQIWASGVFPTLLLTYHRHQREQKGAHPTAMKGPPRILWG